jgi:hypothetical protein
MSVTLTAPPISTACFDYSWHSAVKQSNDFGGTGNDFALQGADAALTVAKLVVTGQPAAVVQAGSTFSTSVSAEDGCGTVLKTASGNVALGLGANPSGGTLSGTLSQPLTSGVASFGDLAVDAVGTGYTLAASLSSFAATTSDPFDVANVVCTTGHTCHAQNDPTSPTTSVDSPAPPKGATLGLGFNSHISFACNGASTPVGALVLIDPSGYPSSGTFTVTLTYAKSISGSRPASSFAVCISKDGGTSWTLLAACVTSTDHPCIVSEKRVNQGDLAIVLRLAPLDPYSGAS